MATTRKFTDIVGDIDSDRRSRIDALKDEARADGVAFNLGELRRHRQLTQVELAERLERPQASISAMETADDNLFSEDTLETATGAGFSAFFYALFVFGPNFPWLKSSPSKTDG